MPLIQAPIPLALYVHIPWCIKKCPYCDFNSHTLKSDLPAEDYVNALLRDLEQDLPRVKQRSLSTIFIGGGTPSLLPPAQMKRLLQGIRERLPCDNPLEITLEANPGATEQARFAEFCEAGINRLSIGVQSFQDGFLKKLGRIHNVETAKSAILAAKKAGFQQINLDLMFGLPEQTLAEAMKDLEMAFTFETTHLSWYQLTLEPNTAFYHQRPALPEHDAVAEIHEAGQKKLTSQGLLAYEISAYCRDDQTCQHNVNYWEFGDYLGIGAGAHGKITNIENGTIERLSKHRHPKQYLSSTDFIAHRTTLTEEDCLFEFMLNALRLYRPIPFSLFEERTGLSQQTLLPFIEKAVDKKLIEYNDKAFSLTELGQHFYNDVVSLFMPKTA